MEICDFIEFNIYGKVRKIELCLGDISKISKNDSVDLLLLSAFPDNYMPIKGTLIGALQDNLNISVKLLARDKAEDLRQKFNCWISKELSPHLPFRRILCFEQVMKSYFVEDQSNLVGAMFRAIFTTFTNKDMSIMTPILASGNQRSNKKQMLNELVRACSAWISAEMPLSCMKIVIYRSKIHPSLDSDDLEAITEFSKLKSEINWKPYKNELSIHYDVSFFYVKEDEETVIIFTELLNKLCHTRGIKMKLKCLNKKEYAIYSNNYNIYEKFHRKMLESRKAGIFLSPHFLDNPQAIEVYNLALCISQKAQTSLLTPICLQHIDNLPEYMSITQWIDCKIKKDKQNFEDQLQCGANCFYQILEDTLKPSGKKGTNSESMESANKSVQQKFENFNYDIFLSYSHKDDEKCNSILHFLELSLPNARIFHDKHDIKTGFSWQEIIFNSLNGSKIVLALLSENYIQSPMCRDEFNIAISQDWSSQFETKFFPIWISDRSIQSVVVDYPTFFNTSFLMNNIFIASFSNEPLVLLSAELQVTALFVFFTNKVIQPLLMGKPIEASFINEHHLNFEEATLKARMEFFRKTWEFGNLIDFITCNKSLSLNTKSLSVKTNDVAIGFHIDDIHLANYLKSSLLKVNKDLKIVFCPMGHKSDESQSLKSMETVYLIVILLKSYYIMTKSCRDQLNIALSLQRRSVDSRLVFLPIILETLQHKPSYLHLLPSRFNADDEIYSNLGKKLEYSQRSQTLPNVVLIYDVKVSKKVAIMLTFASHWIAEKIFTKMSFTPPKSLVIYSTYDLTTTNFDVPQVVDSITVNKQIKLLHISEDEINLAKIFLKSKEESARQKPDYQECVRSDISERPQIITSVCSTM